MEEGGTIYCFTCWEQNFAHRCAKCGSAEGMGEASIKALGMHYHRQCFTCVECRSPLAGTQFTEKGGHPCCVGCAEVQRHYVGVGVDGYSDFKADGGYRQPPPAVGYRGMDEVIAASRPPTRAAPAAPPPPPSSGGYGDYGYEEGAPPPPPSSRTHEGNGRRVRRQSTSSTKPCAVAGCQRPRAKGGYCVSHHQQEHYSRGEPSPPVPSVPYVGGRGVGGGGVGAGGGSRSRGVAGGQPSCHKCRRDLGYNTEYTVANVGGAQRQFHKDCFCCVNCEVPIGHTGSKRHMEHDGRIYCIGCWEHKDEHRCHRCQGGVYAGEAFLLAMGKKWHRNCFQCSRCRTPLAATGDSRFFEAAGQPCCGSCVGGASAGVGSRGGGRQVRVVLFGRSGLEGVRGG